MNFRVKNHAGPWTPGQIITEDDIKAHPQFGGVARLRDKLGAIEDTTDEPSGDKAVAAPTKPGPVTAMEIGPGGKSPNVGRQPPAGKS